MQLIWGANLSTIHYQHCKLDNKCTRENEPRPQRPPKNFWAIWMSQYRHNRDTSCTGDIGRFKSTNALWGYFNSPIGTLLGRTGEIGLWPNCGLPHAWRPFWGPMRVIQKIRSDGGETSCFVRGEVGAGSTSRTAISGRKLPIAISMGVWR